MLRATYSVETQNYQSRVSNNSRAPKKMSECQTKAGNQISLSDSLTLSLAKNCNASLSHSLILTLSLHCHTLSFSHSHSHSQSCEKVTLLHQRFFRTPKNLHQKCVNRDTFIIAKSYELPKKALIYS